NYWRRAAVVDLRTAVCEAVRTAFVPCLCAGLASAIGQAWLMSSSLAAIREFGLYAAAGTLISLLVTLYALPCLLQIWPGKRPRAEELNSAFWPGLAAWIGPRHKIVTAVSLVACCACMLGLKDFRTETKGIRYFSDNTRI